MIWIYIIIGLASGAFYYIKEHDLKKAVFVLTFWPLIIIVVLIMLPMAVYKIMEEKRL